MARLVKSARDQPDAPRSKRGVVKRLECLTIQAHGDARILNDCTEGVPCTDVDERGLGPGDEILPLTLSLPGNAVGTRIADPERVIVRVILPAKEQAVVVHIRAADLVRPDADHIAGALVAQEDPRVPRKIGLGRRKVKLSIFVIMLIVDTSISRPSAAGIRKVVRE